MTRIIGGTAGGRRIEAPRGTSTRPTSDRVREALFSTIDSRIGPLSGLRFLDLYAGSGAVGLEAWSRGAGVVTLVESDRRTAGVIASNASALGCRKAQVITWVPSYHINESQQQLNANFGGVGMADGLSYLGLQFWLTDGPTARLHQVGEIPDGHEREVRVPMRADRRGSGDRQPDRL